MFLLKQLIGSGFDVSSVPDTSLDSDVLLYVPFTDADSSTTADGYVLSGGTHTFTSYVFSAA